MTSPLDVAAGPACSRQSPFYWEIGDRNGILTSGSVGADAPSRDTVLGIASASKWPYAAYVAQTKRLLTSADIFALNFTDGWVEFDDKCKPFDTVASCAADLTLTPASVGKFHYSGAHMQHHGALSPIAPDRNAALAVDINRALGTTFSYVEPQLAGGMNASAAAYALFLQRIIRGELRILDLLSSFAVSTQGPTAEASPVPEPWHYSLGHWIELDGTLSSPGAFGFYPWIDASRRFYGVLARKALGGAWSSVTCGRAIRQAFLS